MPFARHLFPLFCLSLLLLLPLNANAQTDRLPRIFDAQSVRRALDYLKTSEPDTINEQIKVCEIPAPTFHESKRGEYFKQRFSELGLKNVRIDSIGNVIGERGHAHLLRRPHQIEREDLVGAGEGLHLGPPEAAIAADCVQEHDQLSLCHGYSVRAMIAIGPPPSGPWCSARVDT